MNVNNILSLKRSDCLYPNAEGVKNLLLQRKLS